MQDYVSQTQPCQNIRRGFVRIRFRVLYHEPSVVLGRCPKVTMANFIAIKVFWLSLFLCIIPLTNFMGEFQ